MRCFRVILGWGHTHLLPSTHEGCAAHFRVGFLGEEWPPGNLLEPFGTVGAREEAFRIIEVREEDFGIIGMREAALVALLCAGIPY
jgi:hypothetical protein